MKNSYTMHPKGLLHEPPLTAIRPEGWMRDMLLQQRDGLTGHLEVAGYPFNTRGWRSHKIPLGERGGTGWWPYEQFAYWVDGQIRCGLLLNDAWLTQRARKQIDHVLARPDRDGYLGPRMLKTLPNERSTERWPHAVFFRAIMADYDERPSKKTLQKLIRHYLSGTAEHYASRNVCNIEIMAWLYEKTGDTRMRDLAETSYAAFQLHNERSGATLKNMRTARRAKDHGPTYMELFKLGAILYRITGSRRYLDASVNAQRKLARDHVLIDGVPSATEHLRGQYSTAGHETCVITDYLWALGILLTTTRDAQYADAMERIVFNALPGAVTEDFKALQYFSGPNQVVTGPQTNHHPHGTACAHISYRPNPATECCPGNVHRALPAYAGRMWLTDPQGGVVAALYGPSRFTHTQAGRRMTVVQETDYPFGDRVTFRFAGKHALKFAFSFRIPGWCAKATATFNGRPLKAKLETSTFVRLTRTFRDGDCIELTLPRTLRAVKGPENGIGLEYGPLVLSLRIPEERMVEPEDTRSTREFPAWTFWPAKPWNYGLTFAPGRAVRTAEIAALPLSGNPWDAAHTPLRILVPAHRIPGWRLIRKKKLVMKWGDKTHTREGNIQFMPPLPDDEKRARASTKEEWIELVPYGATRLRVTWFPRL